MIVKREQVLQEKLKAFICHSKFAIACVGTPFRSDDAVGLMIYGKLLDYACDSIIKCEYGLENCLLQIEKLKPEKLIIVDAVSYDAPPGTILLFTIDRLLEEDFTSSHNIPLKVILDYLREASMVKEVLFLGISVGKLGFNMPLSREVVEATELVVATLKYLVNTCR